MTAVDVPRTTSELEQAIAAANESTRPRLATGLGSAVKWAAPRAGRVTLATLYRSWRVTRWLAIEMVTFLRDLGGLINRLSRIHEDAAKWLAGGFVAGGLAAYLAVFFDKMSAREMVAAVIGCWAGFAAVTAVPRARHHIRRELHHAVHSVTAGGGDNEKSHAKVRRPRRVRWKFGTRQLKSAHLQIPPSWRRGQEKSRDQLADELAWRLSPHGSYRLTWKQGQPMPRVHRITELPSYVAAQPWTPPRGVILLGVTESHTPRAVRVRGAKGLAFVGWNLKSVPHLLMCGETGNGKTAAMRYLTRSVRDGITAHGKGIAQLGFDGKGAGNLSYLDNREGVVGVGNTAREWVDLVKMGDAEMRRRYDAIRAWRTGDAPKPYFADIWVLHIDELVDICAECGDAFIDPLGRIARLGRECGVHLVASVLRPDVAESIPGLIRAQLNGRLYLGALHDFQTAQMMFGDQAKKAQRLSDDEDDVPGRGIARFGRMFKVQLPYTEDPAEDRAGGELWLPRRLATVTHLPTDQPARERRDRPASEDRQAQVIEGEVIDLTAPDRRRRRGAGDAPVDLTGGDQGEGDDLTGSED
jgi:hypothetical protein